MGVISNGRQRLTHFLPQVVDAVRIYRWFWNELVYELEIVGVLTVLQEYVRFVSAKSKALTFSCQPSIPLFSKPERR